MSYLVYITDTFNRIKSVLGYGRKLGTRVRAVVNALGTDTGRVIMTSPPLQMVSTLYTVHYNMTVLRITSTQATF